MKKIRPLLFLLSLILCLGLTSYAFADTRTLKYGSVGEDVVSVQARLTELGYLAGADLTSFDRDTVAAVKLFQAASGMRQTGTLTGDQQSALMDTGAVTMAQYNLVMPLTFGNKGDAVRALQERLAALGYLAPEQVDADYGTSTQAAVSEFQRAAGLRATGKADTNTRQAMNAQDAITCRVYQLTCELKYGSRLPAVNVLQERLRTLGYYAGELTGVYDRNTRQAVTDFQNASGLPATGNADANTRALMNGESAPAAAAYYEVCALKYGERRPAVVNLQVRLIQLGYYVGDASGAYDRKTLDAVKEFQTASGLRATGNADENTRRAMNGQGAVTAAQYYQVCALKYGSRHAAVKVLQARLIALGYMGGEPTGVYGQETKAAVADFQAASGLRANGVADTATRQRMIADSAMTAAEYYKVCAVRTGSKGESVKLLQQELSRLGFYNGKLSGTFDKDTRIAVSEFQSANGLKATGVADVETRKLMISGSAKNSEAYYRTLPLRYNATSAAVRVLQARLTELGYFSGNLSNTYGQSTRKAVAEFQTANSLRSNGVADAATREAMLSGTAVTLAEYNKIRPLASGATGDSVTLVQQQLKELGYYTANLTGRFDTATKLAVKTFQQANGLTANMKADAATRKLLNSGTAVDAATYDSYRPLRMGESGSAVKSLQTRLNALGYFFGAMDGRYGTTTRDAVRVFQAANNLKVSGAADTDTRKAMNAATAVTRTAYDANRTVGKGESGATVRAIQVRLDELGYYTNTNNVIYDAKLIEAVKLFQTAHSLKATGSADVDTRRQLFSSDALTYENYNACRALKYGEKSEAVSMVERQLSNLGYYTHAIDNYFGLTLRNAVKVFQAANGFTVDGNVTVEMRKLLNSGGGFTLAEYYKVCPLTKGNSGEAVKLLQTRLHELGYYDGKIDGSYSSAVVEAVGMFQTANCLTKTGSADRETREKMYCTKVVTYKAFLSSNPADLVSCSASSRTQKIEKLIAVAQSKLGCKYVLNSKGPNTFDCSNFTKFCFNAVGVSISGAVIKQGYMTGYTKITDPSQLQRGDLLIFDTVKDDDDLSDHAGIYLGDGTFIHCSSTRGMVVISNFKTYGNFSWGFRLL